MAFIGFDFGYELKSWDFNEFQDFQRFDVIFAMTGIDRKSRGKIRSLQRLLWQMFQVHQHQKTYSTIVVIMNIEQHTRLINKALKKRGGKVFL